MMSTASAVTTVGPGSTITFNTDALTVNIDGTPEPNGVLVAGVTTYTFAGLDLQNGSTVIISGSYPLFIKSTADITISTTVDANAPNAIQAASPTRGPAGPAGGYEGGYYRYSGFGPGGGGYVSSGAAGGGYGGIGGTSGRSTLGAGATYGVEELYTLWGGSGGAGGQYNNMTGAGGGGAIAFQAAGNLTVTTSGSLQSNGGNAIYAGFVPAQLPGAGGAGGSIRLEGGSSLVIQGTVSAKGGQGGDITTENGTLVSGGGGGGRIALYSPSISVTGTMTVAGGRCGKTPGGVSGSKATDGSPGTIYQYPGMMPLIGTIPDPTNAATDVSILKALSWTPNASATSQVVYFGTTDPPATLVASGDGTLSSVTNNQLNGPLDPFTTYYWSVLANGQTQGLVWHFTTGVGKASNPSVADGTIEVSVSLASLTWTGDGSETSYDVYFSTDQAAVLNRTATPTNVATASFTVPGPLAKATKYYWAIDCKAPGGITLPGDVWSFTTETYKVTFDTDALTYSIEGGASGTGVVEPNDPVDANLPRGAVFTFSSFAYDKTWSATVTGSRPLIIKSTGDINIGMRIDVGAPLAVKGTGTPYPTGPAGPAGGYEGGEYRTDGYGPGGGKYINAGAGGGGYGGAGGRSGRANTELGGGVTYNDPELYGLYGGSGGAGAHYNYGSGGGGGGAVALEAAGNINLSADAKVQANGGDVIYPVIDDQLPGAGGSGGSVRLVAGGSVTVAGTVSAEGGQGGDISNLVYPYVPGGGGGGRIALYSGTGVFNISGTVSVAGGRCGVNAVGEYAPATNGADGTIFYGVNLGRPGDGQAEDGTPSGVQGVDIHGPALAWRPDPNSYPTSYDVYFGTSLASLTLLTNVPALSPSDPNLTTTSAPELNILTDYFWRVDSKGMPVYGDVPGVVWMFKTRDKICTNKPVADFNDDCRVTFIDFALFASQWKVCNLLPAEDCN